MTATDQEQEGMTTPPRQRADLELRIPYDGLRGRYGDYLADRGLIDAANVALTLSRPLLLTGEPGCGKTDFADVMANALAPDSAPPAYGAADAAADDADDADDADATRLPAALDPRRPLECHIRSDARARDLLYHYDAILRFTDGQHGNKNARRNAEDARHYIELQALGIALTSTTRRVVLLDEIDKAPRDLPNDLLRELDVGEFEIAEIPMRHVTDEPVHDRTGVVLQRVMRCPKPRPFVVITSNIERQLPDPFLRRCVFFHIPFPDADRLRKIVRRRLGTDTEPGDVVSATARAFANDDDVLDRVVRIFLAARKVHGLTKKPSTAELLDWMVALATYEPSAMPGFLEAFAGALDDGRIRHATLGWLDLPAYGCLFKMREDRDAAALFRAAPA